MVEAEKRSVSTTWPLRERRGDDLRHVLGAVGKVEQQLGQRRRRALRHVHEEAAHLRSEGGAAGLTRLHHGDAARPQGGGGEADLCGLACPLDAFEGDQAPTFSQPTPLCRGSARCRRGVAWP